MRLPRLLSAAAVATVGAVLATASPASAAPLTSYEMPFPCSDSWTGTTRTGHSPSRNAIDWNRTDDLGDPVVAAAAGIVTTAVPDGTRSYGRYVVVDHGNGESTLYGHLSTVTVGVGQMVDQGTLLGTVGQTGNASGPHLHFEERLNGNDLAPYFHGAAFVFGSTQASQNCPDVPLAGNFSGDGVSELTVFDRASSTFQVNQPTGPMYITYGIGTDTPVVGDWDGDGFANPGVRRASDRTFYLSTPGGDVPVRMGRPSDIPVVGDWNGDRATDLGLRKADRNVFRLRRADGTTYPVRLGKASDIPVSGDWNGDGTTDLGVYDVSKARFTLRIQDANGLVWLTRVTYGLPGDLPVTGDWDGNGRTDLGVWRPGLAQFFQRIAASPIAPMTKSVSRVFGTPRNP